MALNLMQGTGLMYPRISLANIAPAFGATAVIDATGEKIAMCGRVFFPSRSGLKNIARVQFMWGAVVKTGNSALTLSLQDVSLTAAPLQPDGVADQTVAIAPAEITANSWFRSNPFNTTRTVANGDLVSVVVEFDGAGRLGSDSFIVNGQVAAAAAAVFVFGQCAISHFTAAWVTLTSIPIIVLEFDDGSFGTLLGSLPVKAINTHIYNLNTAGIDEHAVVINVPFRCKVDGLWVGITIGPTSDFSIVLYSGTTVLETVAIDANSFGGTTPRYVWASIPEREFAPNTDYYVSLKPTTANNVSAYSFDVDNAAHWALHDGGVAVKYASRVDNGAWTPTATRRFLAGVSISQFDDGTGVPAASLPPASKVFAGVNRGDGVLGTLHASNIATAAGAGENLAPAILRIGHTVDDVVGAQTDPVITYPPASKVYAGANRGDGVLGTLHASNIATAAGVGVNLSPAILRVGNTVDDVIGAQTDPVITYPPASKVYAGANRGDGVVGTLHASNIAAAAGVGVNLAPALLTAGVRVDDVTGTLAPPTFPPASKVFAGVNLGTLHASNIATAAGAGENLAPAILRIGHTVDDVVGAQTDPVITYPPASKVYAGANRGDGVIGTLHASNIVAAAGVGLNLTPDILAVGAIVDDVTGMLAPPVVDFPMPHEVYAGVDRGDGTLGTLHASNIAAAAGAGVDLSPEILKVGVVVDDVAGTLALPPGVQNFRVTLRPAF
jgi:hypothetical protein